MAEIQPVNIHPALHCFTYQKRVADTQVIEKLVERSAPGHITATDVGGGVIAVHQAVNSVFEKKFEGTVTHWYALFSNEKFGSLKFHVANQQHFSPGDRIHLWLDKEFWLFQTNEMHAPRVHFGYVPKDGAWGPWYPSDISGEELNTQETQLNLRAAMFQLREFLGGIHKNTPKSFLSVPRLEQIFGTAKHEAGLCYSRATWPKRGTKPSVVGWILSPILKYKAVPAPTPFCPTQTITAELNKRWLSLGFVIGTITFWLFGNELVHSIIRAFGLNQVFWMMTLSGVALQWVAFVLFVLASMAVVMKPAIRRSFAFDESSFFTLINTPYHPKARVGFSSNIYSDHTSSHQEDYSSDKTINDLNIWRAHEQCNFVFHDFAKLESMLSATKLSEVEKNTLLVEIKNYKLPF